MTNTPENYESTGAGHAFPIGRHPSPAPTPSGRRIQIPVPVVVPVPVPVPVQVLPDQPVNMSILMAAVRDETSPDIVTDLQVAHVTNAAIRVMARAAWELQERTDWMSEHAGDPGVAELEQVLDGPPLDPHWQDVATWLARQAGGKGPNWVHGTAIAVGASGHPVTSESSSTQK